MGTSVVLATVLVFMGIPRLPGTLIRSLPFSLGGAASAVVELRRRRGEPLAAGGSGRRGRELRAGRLPGLQRRRRPPRARAPLGPGRVPGPRAAGRPLARGGVRHVRRHHLDDLGSVDRAAAGERRAERRHRPTRARGTDRTRADRPRHPDVLHRDAAAERVVRRGHPGAGVLPVRGAGGGSLRLRPFADPPRRGHGVFRGLRRAGHRRTHAAPGASARTDRERADLHAAPRHASRPGRRPGASHHRRRRQRVRPRGGRAILDPPQHRVRPRRARGPRRGSTPSIISCS